VNIPEGEWAQDDLPAHMSQARLVALVSPEDNHPRVMYFNCGAAPQGASDQLITESLRSTIEAQDCKTRLSPAI
jgi:hypothetical protein